MGCEAIRAEKGGLRVSAVRENVKEVRAVVCGRWIYLIVSRLNVTVTW